MATLREFILNQSQLPTGNTVRDHIQNPGAVGIASYVETFNVLIDDMAPIEIEIDEVEITLEIEEPEITITIDEPDITIEVD